MAEILESVSLYPPLSFLPVPQISQFIFSESELGLLGWLMSRRHQHALGCGKGPGKRRGYSGLRPVASEATSHQKAEQGE